jgi:hypothetical protein
LITITHLSDITKEIINKKLEDANTFMAAVKADRASKELF